MKYLKILLFPIFTLFPLLTLAQLSTARIFSDNMVLQRDIPIPIWGKASPKDKITLIFNNKTYTVIAGKDGKWETKLAALPAGGPYEIQIKAKKEALTLKNILIGDVWVCSGQSNMEWTLQNTNHAKEEIANANYPEIRLFQVKNVVSPKPLDDLSDGEWKACSPETIPLFSSVGYFFGRKLHHDLNVPIGLLHTSWGGTNVETWISTPSIIQNAEEYKEKMKELEAIDMEAIIKQRKEKIKSLIGDIPKNDSGMVDGKAIWANPEIDVSSWKTMKIPQLWESAGLDGLDGIVWFRTEFELKESQIQKGITLHLGKIDDTDISWLNGTKIGETNGYSVIREYFIDAINLKVGKNVLVVRVDDTGGGGGLWGKEEEIFAEVMSSGQKISLTGEWKYKVGKAIIGETSIGPNSYPSLLYNAMVNPLIPYAIKGVIWYQGESNAGKAYRYRDLFPLMIKDWRQSWKQGDFPFLFVQLANFMAVDESPKESAWAELREAQTMTLSLANTGMALAIDIGVADDIHPRNKQDVGKRLALAALKIAYKKDIVHSGPMYKSMKVEGNKIRLSFELYGSELWVKDKYGYLKGFAIAGSDKKFYWAKAKKEGNEVIVYSDEVTDPVAVRYAWGDNPDDANLYNKENLPTVPFRTDDWKGITYGLK